MPDYDQTFGKPGSREWLEENRRRSAVGELPLSAPTAQYRVLRPAYVGGRMAEGGEIVVLPMHEVRTEDTHLELVKAPAKPVVVKSEVEAPPVLPKPVVPPPKPMMSPSPTKVTPMTSSPKPPIQE